MGAEASAAFEKADAELNRVYNLILERYSADSVFIAKLKIAQRQWITTCEADLDMVFPYKDIDPQSNYGTSFSICYLIHWTILTQDRTKFLKLWSDAQYSEPCDGSIGRY